jgi:hypothetical protein
VRRCCCLVRSLFGVSLLICKAICLYMYILTLYSLV